MNHLVRRLVRPLVAGVAAAGTAAALLAGAAGPASAAPETRVRPAQLERGADPGVPYVDGRTLKDGPVELTVDGGSVRLLGTSGDDYVVGSASKNGLGRYKVHRYAADGSRELLFRGVSIWELVLSDDGTRVLSPEYVDRRSSRIRVFDATDGSVVGRRTFTGFVNVLDGEGGEVLVGATSPERTFVWVPGESMTRVSDRYGYEGDLGSDRLAFFTGDPYRDGCSRVVALSDVTDTLWRSCNERVDTFSPGGTRLTSIHILSDGIGPNQVRLREDDGTVLRRYTVDGYFGSFLWESETSLLMEAYGRSRWALVRCVDADCERATRLRDTPAYRTAVSGRSVLPASRS